MKVGELKTPVRFAGLEIPQIILIFIYTFLVGSRQNGFSHYFVIIAVIVIGIIGFAGFRIYKVSSTDKPTGKNYKTIVALGDIACDKSKTAAPTECGDLDTYRETALINPDAILAPGDIQYDSGSLNAYRSSFDSTWKQLKSKFYPSPGNHEYYTTAASGYYTYFKDAPVDVSLGYYSFTLGSWKIISLNSNCDTTNDCSTDSEQLKWLRSELSKDTDKCTLAFWHHPRFTSGKYFGNTDSTSRGTYMWDALLNSNADVVLNGHDHLYERFAPQNNSGQADPHGIREFIVGSGGRSHYAKTDSASNSEKLIDDKYGVLKMKLYTNSYAWEFYDTNNNVLDSGSSSCY